jgi:hypothetical protein
MNDHTLIMAFWILKDGAPPVVTNIITTLCGTDILEAAEGCNNDDDKMTLTFLMKQLRPQMIVTTMNLNPNIQILPLVILLGHKSQGLHNHKHLAFYNSCTYVEHYMQIHMVA